MTIDLRPIAYITSANPIVVCILNILVRWAVNYIPLILEASRDVDGAADRKTVGTKDTLHTVASFSD